MVTRPSLTTPQEFYDFCVARNACEKGLAEIKGLTLAEWWDQTRHGSYMMWLCDHGLWKFTPEQRAEYKRVTAAAWAEYERVTAQAWAEYERVTAEKIRSIIGNPFAGRAA